MCLIFVQHRVRAELPLVVVANRDERHARPSLGLHRWDDAPHIVAGRDVEGGGTWLGVSARGRFAAVTNFREPMLARSPTAPSRGALVHAFLDATVDTASWLDSVADEGRRYNGFNLLVHDGHDLGWYSNRGGAARVLEPGLYGLSNHLLDTPWPKVVHGKARLGAMLAAPEAPPPSTLIDFLRDDRAAEDAALPDTGVGLARERVLSPMFITAPDYGTRCSTVVLVHADGRIEVTERGYGAMGARGEERTIAIDEATARGPAAAPRASSARLP
ncbi:MAG: NRDE family protein [Ectothiorhodospiraceae bacterium]|nr:NRDE family protein [Chromatiales bacterium]MCP5154700.1 NRDE family protein [Ectothiorhodospiraceae bacterium]